MTDQQPPPAYHLADRPPGFGKSLRNVLSDPAAVIPASILTDWSYKMPGPGFPLVISHPDAVRDVLLDDGERFGRNRQLRMLMRRAWGEGLAAAEGERWAEQRKAAAPAFRPRAVQAATDAMGRTARQRTQAWPVGQPIELGQAIGRIVTEVVMETLLSGLRDLDLDQVTDDIAVVSHEVATFGLLEAAPLPHRLISRLRGLGRSDAEARLRTVAARLAAARAEPPDEAQDLPALLRGVGPLTDNILGFMLAGFGTTALAAAWAVYLLALYPEWQEKVRREALDANGSEDDRAPATARLVAQEAMRLYPPAPFLARSAARRTTLQGTRLLPGQAVLIHVYAIQRHRELWDMPDAFDPSRFEAPASYNRNAFLPFGAGPRICIAGSFALAEVSVIVSELVRAFHFTPAGLPPEVSLKVSTSSTTGMNVLAQPIDGQCARRHGMPDTTLA